MFSTFKKKTLKKAINKATLEGVESNYDFPLRVIGILIEKSEVSKVDELIQSLRQNGAKAEQIYVLVYTGLTKSKQLLDPSFSMKDFSIIGDVQNQEVKKFIEQPFDLLINFYAKDIVPLLWVSAKSKAKFKVGIAAVTPRINHFSLEMQELQAAPYIKHLMNYITIFKTK
ncbi:MULTISPECIES: hypothetical protein [unclassified Myroides]|uniref:DUF6913 domain-containing protein n=1 Tax=unclassified Myroides TaxID=2642485 RepID=UPI0015FCA9C8|nr:MULTISPECIES: hypothetical protein [unclassified Myroides]MBB1150399.1 hypothetical protein [Myroides sp. NP-2]MDM1407361.1 hypothetical protein [Myroides sp. DF42-4-2]